MGEHSRHRPWRRVPRSRLIHLGTGGVHSRVTRRCDESVAAESPAGLVGNSPRDVLGAPGFKRTCGIGIFGGRSTPRVLPRCRTRRRQCASRGRISSPTYPSLNVLGRHCRSPRLKASSKTRVAFDRDPRAAARLRIVASWLFWLGAGSIGAGTGPSWSVRAWAFSAWSSLAFFFGGHGLIVSSGRPRSRCSWASTSRSARDPSQHP